MMISPAKLEHAGELLAREANAILECHTVADAAGMRSLDDRDPDTRTAYWDMFTTGQYLLRIAGWIRDGNDRSISAVSDAGYRSMFEQAARTLAAIDQALDIGDDGCADSEQTLYAIALLRAQIETLKAERDQWQQQAVALARTVLMDQAGAA